MLLLLTCLVFVVFCYIPHPSPPLAPSCNVEESSALNIRIIDEVNRNKNAGWVAGYNEFIGSKSIKEAKRLLGVKPNEKKLRLVTYDKALKAPKSFDATQKWPGCIGPVLNQGDCGSCWAFGAAESISDRYCINHNPNGSFVQFAPLDITTCDSYDDGCDGGSLYGAWNFVQSNGIVTEDCAPYLKSDGGPIPTCDASQQPCLKFVQTPNCPSSCRNGTSWSAAKHKVVQSIYGVNGEHDYQQELMKNGPFEVAMSVYQDFLAYKNGVYSHQSGGFLGGHALKLIGWGELNGKKYWKIQNSWTTKWADLGGYFLIERGNDQCGIESSGVAGKV